MKKNNKMLISIIIPVYNVDKYLEECLESVVKQSYADIEVILINDGSTDNSYDICQKYENKFKNFKLVNKENEGLGLTRNRGIELASGEYVFFLDSDDYIDSNLIEKMVEEVKDGTEFVKSGFKRVTDDKKILSVTDYDNLNFESKQIKNELMPRIIGSSPKKKDSIEMASCAVLYKLDLIKNNNIKFYSEREYISEDLIFNFDYLNKCKKAKVVDFIGYNYRYNPNSLTKKYRNDRFESCLKIYNYMKVRISKDNLPDETINRLNRIFFIYLKMCISQEKKKTSNLSSYISIKNIKKICNNNDVIHSIREYPVKDLHIKQKIFVYLIKYKCSLILYLLSNLNII